MLEERYVPSSGSSQLRCAQVHSTCRLVKGACPAVNGEWHVPRASKDVIDPMNGEPFIKLPDPQVDEIDPYVQSLRAVPKSGMHNPLKNLER